MIMIMIMIMMQESREKSKTSEIYRVRLMAHSASSTSSSYTSLLLVCSTLGDRQCEMRRVMLAYQLDGMRNLYEPGRRIPLVP